MYISSKEPGEFGVSPEIIALSITASVLSLLKNVAQTVRDARKRNVSVLRHVADITQAGTGVTMYVESIAKGEREEASYRGVRLLMDDIKQIVHALKSPQCKLRTLDLHDCGLDREMVALLAEGVLASKTLGTLDLDGFDLPVQDLKGATGKTKLDFRSKGLTDLSAVVIGALLPFNAPLKT